MVLSVVAIVTIIVGCCSFFAPLHFYVRLGNTRLVRALVVHEKCHIELVRIATVHVKESNPLLWSDRSHRSLNENMSHFTIRPDWLEKTEPMAVLISSDQSTGPTSALTFPCWVPAMLFGSYPLLSGVARRRCIDKCRRENRCRICGYSREGATSDRCTECGAFVNEIPIKKRRVLYVVVITSVIFSAIVVWVGARSPTVPYDTRWDVKGKGPSALTPPPAFT